GFGLYEIVRKHKLSWQAGLGMFSILLTGGFKILKLPPEWVAWKEGSVPFVLAMAILVSAWIGRPLARLFLDQVLDRERIDAALAERGNAGEYERRTAIATYLLAGTFLLSATLNFMLAKIIVTSDPSTSAYNSEIGRMTALSFPAITVPVMIAMTITIIYIMMTVSRLTGLEAETVLKQKPGKNAKKPVTSATEDDAVSPPAEHIIDIDSRPAASANPHTHYSDTATSS
ncbi:MAG: VC0807 family protein, partial [Thermomicrobiales bacterium]